jgi:hypothetical protein
MLSKSPPTKILPSGSSAIEESAGRVWVEGGVECAVGVQSGNVVSRDLPSTVGGERCKAAADENLAVGLDEDDANQTVGVRIETVERGLPAHRRRAARQ